MQSLIRSNSKRSPIQTVCDSSFVYTQLCIASDFAIVTYAFCAYLGSMNRPTTKLGPYAPCYALSSALLLVVTNRAEDGSYAKKIPHITLMDGKVTSHADVRMI